MFGVPAVLAFSTIGTRQSQLSLIISEFHEDAGAAAEVARLVLPLMWFPVNRIVTYPFPMITRRPDVEVPMVLLDVHLSNGKTSAFACAPGKLRVVPTWPIPEVLQFRPPDAGDDGDADAAKSAGQVFPMRVPISTLITQEVIDAQQQAVAPQ
jgi:hypothetical protein